MKMKSGEIFQHLVKSVSKIPNVNKHSKTVLLVTFVLFEVLISVEMISQIISMSLVGSQNRLRCI